MSRLGYVDEVLAALAARGIVFEVYDTEHGPSDAVSGASLMSAFDPDCIVALGGGTVIDAAKVRFLSSHALC